MSSGSGKEIADQAATSGPRKTTRKKKPSVEPVAENPAAHMHVHWAYEGA